MPYIVERFCYQRPVSSSANTGARTEYRIGEAVKATAFCVQLISLYCTHISMHGSIANDIAPYLTLNRSLSDPTI